MSKQHVNRTNFPERKIRTLRRALLGALLLAGVALAPAWSQAAPQRSLVAVRVPVIFTYQFPFDAPPDFDSPGIGDEILNTMRLNANLQLLIRPTAAFQIGVETGVSLGVSSGTYQDGVEEIFSDSAHGAAHGYINTNIPVRGLIGFGSNGFGLDLYGGIVFLDVDSFLFDQYAFDVGARVNLFRFLTLDVGYVLPADTFHGSHQETINKILNYSGNTLRVGIGVNIGG